MAETIAETAARWDLEGHTTTAGEQFNELHARIDFLRRYHYDQYIPTLGPDQISDFDTRLERWLARAPDEEDQRRLLELAPQIIFFGRDEFTKLHQAAMSGPIM